MPMFVLYSSSNGQDKVGMVEVMLVLYISSGRHGEVGMVDAYVGAV